MIKISIDMIGHYLGNITLGWFDRNETPPENLSDYSPCLQGTRAEAERFKDVGYYKLGLQWLILSCAKDDVLFERLNMGLYPYDPEEIYDIAAYVYKSFWPEETMPEVAPDIELINMALQEWREQRDALNPQMPPVGGPVWQADYKG